MSAKAKAAGRLLVGVAWRQWRTVLIGAAVIAAMVLVAETARRDAERHLHAQVLVERVRADGQAIAAVHWQGLATLRAGAEQLTGVQSQLVHRGLADWDSLSATLTTLRAVEPGAASARLEASADTMYLEGMRAVLAFNAGDIKQVLQADGAFLRPQFATFDAYAQQAADNQQTVARRASKRAAVLYVGSLVVGLALLLLLGWRLHRQRRHASLSEARLALERHSEQRLRALVEHSSDVITVVDPALAVTCSACATSPRAKRSRTSCATRHSTTP